MGCMGTVEEELRIKWKDEARARISSRYGDRHFSYSEDSIWVAGYVDAKRETQSEIDRLRFELDQITKDRDNLIAEDARNIVIQIAKLVSGY